MKNEFDFGVFRYQPKRKARELDYWQQTIDLLESDPAFDSELIQALRIARIETANPFDEWTESDLFDLWMERLSIIQIDGGVPADQASRMAIDQVLAKVGEKRFHRIVGNERSNTNATANTPEKNDSQNLKFASFPTNCISKVAAECDNTRQPDHFTEMERSDQWQV